ncbi:MAG: ABC transporter permease [Alphaproteobacteria bacterium]|nr:ABC transporter permease [Alphaproteobacteria bacterium]
MTAEAVSSTTKGPDATRVRVPDWMYPILALVVVIAIWDIGVRVFDVKAFILPPPWKMMTALFKNWTSLSLAMLYTLMEIMAGFAMSVIVGVGLAIAIVSARILEKTVFPLIVGSQVIPKVAIAPLFVIWFGFGITPKILIAFLISFFPIIISTVIGLRSIDLLKLHLARSMGASPAQVFFRFRLPNAMPAIFGGLKLSITAAVIGAIVGEFIGSDKGIGRILLIANGNLDTDVLFAGILILSIVGVVLFLIIDVIERIVIRWHVSQRLKHGVVL